MKQLKQEDDPLIYASFISTALQERNPLVIWGQHLKNSITVLFTFRKNMQESKAQVSHLESQIQKIEGMMVPQDRESKGHQINLYR